MQPRVEAVLPAMPGDDLPGTKEPLQAESQTRVSSLGVCCSDSPRQLAVLSDMEEQQPWQLGVER